MNYIDNLRVITNMLYLHDKGWNKYTLYSINYNLIRMNKDNYFLIMVLSDILFS